MTTTRRRPGTGSIYQRERDGLWCAAFTISATPRRRRVITATTREALEAKIKAAGLANLPARQARTRTENITVARAVGSHTSEEWWALVRSHPKVCRYCDVPLNAFNGTQDHKVPISRGGSDAIDNLDYICWQCNAEKGARTPEEYVYAGPRPRPFSPAPTARADWERVSCRA